tara:strand:- start:1189 stop:2121 length:933 start_codon:yes stop_codon:yes gene_type:complete
MTDEKNKYFDEEINLSALINDLYSRRLVYSISFLVMISLSVFILLSIPNEFETSSVISVKKSSENMETNFNSVALALNPLSSLGSNMGSSRKSYALRLLKSRTFFEYLVNEDKNLLVELYAFESYDKDKNVDIFDEEVFSPSKQKWKDGLFEDGQPSILLAHKIYLKHLKIEEQESLENYLTLKIRHQSPILAKRWLDNLIDSFNAYVKEKEEDEASLSLNYLNISIAKTQVPEVKAVIANLIKNKIKDLMITNVSDEYILKVIDKPFLPEKKTYPNRSLILIVLITLMSVLIVLNSLLFPKKNNSQYSP